MDDTTDTPTKAKDDSAQEQGAEGEVRSIPIERIKRSPHQVRDTFDQEFLEGMSKSLKEQGLLHPIIVQQMGDAFELVSGEQRLRAAKLAGFSNIEARVIHKQMTPLQASVLGLVENLQRKDLSPIETARGVKRLMMCFNLSQAEVAAQLRISKSAVSRAAALLEFPPEVQESLERGDINSRHVRAVVGIDSAEERASLLKQAAEERWSPDETESRARKSRSRPVRHKAKADEPGAVLPQPAIEHWKALEAALRLLANFVGWLIHLWARLRPGSRIALALHAQKSLASTNPADPKQKPPRTVEAQTTRPATTALNGSSDPDRGPTRP